ncbi:Uncharacterised protein [Mycobacterium tuberculosis]|nr:Uncharacterised protein [Mycobacterium tuberculosis]
MWWTQIAGGGSAASAPAPDVTATCTAAKTGLAPDAVQQPRPVHGRQSVSALGLLHCTHQRLHGALPGLHRLLRELGQRPHDAAERAAERSADA